MFPVVFFSIAIAHSAPGSGLFSVNPETVLTETKTSLFFTYHVGPDGLSVGDEIQIHDPIFHGMRWSKWGRMSPWDFKCEPIRGGDDGLSSWGQATTASIKEDVILSLERSHCNTLTFNCLATGHDKVWTSVIVEGGELVEGDTVTVTLGDTSTNPNCGLQVGPRVYPNVWWPVSEVIDGVTTDLEPPLIHIKSVFSPSEVLAVVPSQAVVGEPFEFKVSILDEWGNAMPNNQIEARISFQAAGTGSDQSHSFQENENGWHDFSVRINEPGVFWLEVETALGLEYSNPVEVFDKQPEFQILWGDIHSHHGYSWFDEDGILHDLNHSYARDVVGLDVSSESQKAKPTEADGDALWEELTQTCAEMSVDGSFLVLQGFEWVGAWSIDLPSQDPGHHNAYYDSCDGPLADHYDLTSLEGEQGLWQWIHDLRDAESIDAITIPHATAYTHYYFESYDNDIQKGIEIFSGWGDSELGMKTTGAGGLDDLFQNDIRVGMLAGSDNHDGWMGNPYYLTDHNGTPGGGYVAFLAEELTRESIFSSLKNRRTYATTANRAIIHFSAIDGGETVQMGNEYLAIKPSIEWAIHGTGALDHITIFAIEMGGKSPRYEMYTEAGKERWSMSGTINMDWDGKTNIGVWARAEQANGELIWSSPVWLTNDCKRIQEGAIDPLWQCSDPPDTSDTSVVKDTADTNTDTNTDTQDSDTAAPADTDGGDEEPEGSCGCTQSGHPSSIFWGWLLLMTGVLYRRRTV